MEESSMTINQSNELLTPFIEKAKIDGDPFLVCHFSREQDRYAANHKYMDAFDAMIVIKELVKHFGINETLLSTAIEK